MRSRVAAETRVSNALCAKPRKSLDSKSGGSGNVVVFRVLAGKSIREPGLLNEADVSVTSDIPAR